MSAYPWIKVETALPDHPKSRKLCRLLDDRNAWAYPLAIWLYCARFAPGGTVADDEDSVQAFEEAAGWEGTKGELVKALVKVGFLDQKARRISVHDWVDYQGAHIKKLADDRARMRAKRAEVRANGRATVPRLAADRPSEEKTERKTETEKETQTNTHHRLATKEVFGTGTKHLVSPLDDPEWDSRIASDLPPAERKEFWAEIRDAEGKVARLPPGERHQASCQAKNALSEKWQRAGRAP